MKKVILFIASALMFWSCSQDPVVFIDHLEGYWEIEKVEQNNAVLKEFTISTMVDYFVLTTDSTGFRKKVSPKLDGSYIVTQHDSPFTLKIEDHKLNIYYTVDDVSFTETIKFASDEVLIITNDQGFVYTYKPFTQISLE